MSENRMDGGLFALGTAVLKQERPRLHEMIQWANQSLELVVLEHSLQRMHEREAQLIRKSRLIDALKDRS